MDQNDSSDTEGCHGNFIRPSSSSMIRAPSWSFGFGANLRDLDDDLSDCEDHEGCCCDNSSTGQHQIQILSSSLPANPNGFCRRRQSTVPPVESVPPWPKMTIEIPTVYLTRKSATSSSSFHVYQLHLATSSNVEWSVYRRYSQFLTLHQQLKSRDHAIRKFSFPPKRRLNSKASTIVQERRRRLEDYMERLNEYVAKLPVVSASSESYQMLNELATHGPKRPQQVDDALEEVGSTCESTQSEHGLDMDHEQQQQQQQQQQQHHELEGLADDGTSQGDRAVQDTTATEEATSQRLPTNDKSKQLSVRYLFYEFISPDGIKENPGITI